MEINEFNLIFLFHPFFELGGFLTRFWRLDLFFYRGYVFWCQNVLFIDYFGCTLSLVFRDFQRVVAIIEYRYTRLSLFVSSEQVIFFSLVLDGKSLGIQFGVIHSDASCGSGWYDYAVAGIKTILFCRSFLLDCTNRRGIIEKRFTRKRDNAFSSLEQAP